MESIDALESTTRVDEDLRTQLPSIMLLAVEIDNTVTVAVLQLLKIFPRISITDAKWCTDHSILESKNRARWSVEQLPQHLIEYAALDARLS